MIDADQPGFDTGIELDQARGVRVYHNTVYSTDAVVSFFSSIDYRFPNTVADIRNNLVRVITMRDGATGTVDHNLMNVPAGYFVSPPAVDLHLTASATGAIDQGVVLDMAGLDIDDQPHDRGLPDLGADERQP